MKTDVIFKLEGASPVAFFPGLIGTNNPYTCTCYAHVGQHGSSDVGYAAQLKRATAKQFKPLARKLRLIGYRLNIVRKFTRKHLAIRKTESFAKV